MVRSGTFVSDSAVFVDISATACDSSVRDVMWNVRGSSSSDGITGNALLYLCTVFARAETFLGSNKR